MGYKKPPKKNRFKKGKSGNPKGRPKGSRSMKTVLAEIIERNIKIKDPIDGEMAEMPIQNVIALRLVANALKGEQRAITEVMDRIDGKPIQALEHTGDVTINLIEDEDLKDVPA